jgi:hypothetical protein
MRPLYQADHANRSRRLIKRAKESARYQLKRPGFESEERLWQLKQREVDSFNFIVQTHFDPSTRVRLLDAGA